MFLFNRKAHDHCINRLAYGGLSGHLYSASRDKTIGVWDINSSLNGEVVDSHPVTRLTGHTLTINALDVNPIDNNELVSGSRDYSIRFWDIPTNHCKSSTEINQNCITGLKWIPNETTVLQASEDLSLRVNKLCQHNITLFFVCYSMLIFLCYDVIFV